MDFVNKQQNNQMSHDEPISSSSPYPSWSKVQLKWKRISIVIDGKTK
jgi:hypothetical protein